METKISIFNRTFWDAWLMKIMRNLASVKYQFMVAFFVVIVYGMFFHKTPEGQPFISAIQGLSFLSGGFISLATSRMILRTSLFEPKESKEGEFNTDR